MKMESKLIKKTGKQNQTSFSDPSGRITKKWIARKLKTSLIAHLVAAQFTSKMSKEKAFG